jgi:nitrogen-specific signal transduction histidine kinase
VLTDSLVTLLQFNIGGHVFERIQPKGFRDWHHSLQIRAEDLAKSSRSPRSPNSSWPQLSPLAAAVGIEKSFWMNSQWRSRAEVWMVKGQGEEIPPPLISEIPGENTPTPSGIAYRRIDYQNILNETPIPIVLTDSQGDIIEANREARVLFWEGREGFLEGSLSDILEAIEGEKDLVTVKRLLGSRPVLRAYAKKFGTNEVVTAHYFLDITKKQAQTKYIRHLEEKSLSLFAKAESADVIAGILHDLANTLASSHAFMTCDLPILLEVFNREHSSHPELDDILHGAKAFESGVSESIKLLRSAQGIIHGNPRIDRLDLKPIVQEALDLSNRARKKANQISLRQLYTSESLIVVGNQEMLLHSILNLLINATHAMPQGGVLAVKTFRQSEEVVIEISDTGTGIAPEHLPHIFNPYFTTKGLAGKGLGLFMVKRTVENHGGRINVQSELGQGSTFRIFLPAIQQSPDHG